MMYHITKHQFSRTKIRALCWCSIYCKLYMPKNFTPPLVGDATFAQQQCRHYSRVWCICLVYPSLWVTGWTELQRSAEKALQICPEIAGELGFPVTNHSVRNTKKPYYLVKEELGTLWGTKCTLCYKRRCQVNVFCKAIKTCEDHIEVRKQL